MKKNRRILVLDYKMCNLRSISNALKTLNFEHVVSSHFSMLNNCEILILPGVGAFNEAIKNLKKLKLFDRVKKHAEQNKPILGIQLLLTSSEENYYTEGLNIIPGKVVKMPQYKNFKLPHVGWNNIRINKKSEIFKNIKTNSNFYFDHSFEVKLNKKYILGDASYNNSIATVIRKGNVFGTQFHPEKSQNYGLQIIYNFINQYA